MSVNLGAMTVEARLGPCPDGIIHSRPDESLSDQFPSCMDPWVRQGMKGVEHITSETAGYNRVRITCAHVTGQCGSR